MARRHHLQLVPASAAPPPAEQLVLRPVIRFAASELGCPWRVVLEARKPPAARHLPAPFRVVQVSEAEHPGLIEYIPPPERPRPLVRKPRTARARSMGLDKLTPDEKAQMQTDVRWLKRRGVYKLRPRRREDCEGGYRPCPWISCRYHLWMDVVRKAVRPAFPDLEPDQLAETCALDVAERVDDEGRAGLDLVQVGALLNVSMERARQVQEMGLVKIRRHTERVYLPAPPALLSTAPDETDTDS